MWHHDDKDKEAPDHGEILDGVERIEQENKTERSSGVAKKMINRIIKKHVKEN